VNNISRSSLVHFCRWWIFAGPLECTDLWTATRLQVEPHGCSHSVLCVWTETKPVCFWVTFTLNPYLLNPVNMLDLIQKRFAYGQLWPLWPVYSQNCARSYICHIQLPTSNSVPFFQRKHQSYCAIPDWIQSGWPGLVLAKSIWSESKPVSMTHWAWFWQNATRLLPISHLQIHQHSSTDGPDHTVWNQPRSSLIQANCVRFWPNGSSLEASRCARIIGPASEPIQTGSSMFTNKVQWNGLNCLRCSGMA